MASLNKAGKAAIARTTERSSKWKYIDEDGSWPCEAISLDGDNWIDDLIKEDLGNAPECQLVAKDITTNLATYTTQCIYRTEACPSCVDVASSTPRSGGTPASTTIHQLEVRVERASQDRVLYSWRESRSSGENSSDAANITAAWLHTNLTNKSPTRDAPLQLTAGTHLVRESAAATCR